MFDSNKYLVGDKLICKVNYDKPFEIFHKGVEYELSSIKHSVIRHNNNLYRIGKGYFYYGDISKYFYTIKELRNIKLERLRNV